MGAEKGELMSDSAGKIAHARTLLAAPALRPASGLGALGAAALAAMAAILMAGVVVLGPGVTIQDPAVLAP
jgi:hypothetical protein